MVPSQKNALFLGMSHKKPEDQEDKGKKVLLSVSILRGPSSHPAGHTKDWSVPRPAHKLTLFPNSVFVHQEGLGIPSEVLTALSKTSVAAPTAKLCYFSL